MQFSEFLIKNGAVTELDVLDALRYQSQNQTALGRLSLINNFLTILQVMKILDAQSVRLEQEDRGDSNVLFGAMAIELGFLDHKQLAILLEKQKSTRPPLGEALVKIGALSFPDLDSIIQQFEKFNQQDILALCG